MRDEQDEPKDRTPPRNTGGRTPDYIVEQRVRRVQFWMQQGHRTAAIYRLAAKSHGDELTARKRAKKLGKSADEFPPLVWAIEERPVGNRTVDAYIARAKELFEQEGRQLSKEAATQFGVIMARLNDLYARALATKSINTCERLIRLHAELYAIAGSIRPTWVDPGIEPTDVKVPEVAQTEDQSEHELRSMIDTALRRMGRDPKDIAWMPAAASSPGKGKGGALTKGNGAQGN